MSSFQQTPCVKLNPAVQISVQAFVHVSQKKSFFGPPGIKLTFFENFLRHHLALFLGFLCYFDGPERGGHVLEVGSKRMIWKMEVV